MFLSNPSWNDQILFLSSKIALAPNGIAFGEQETSVTATQLLTIVGNAVATTYRGLLLGYVGKLTAS